MTVWEFTLSTLQKMGFYDNPVSTMPRRARAANSVGKQAAANRDAILNKFKRSHFTKHQVASFMQLEPARVNAYLRTLLKENKICYAEPQVGNVPAVYKVVSK
jgi:hypothetical protein